MYISTRRHSLRTRTASSHAALDTLVGDLDTLARYRRYLTGLHAFRQPAEALIAARLSGSAPAAGWRPSPIAGVMREDLAALGMVPGRAIELGSFAGPSALLGLIYVLEGSALGARVLRVQVERLGLTAARGARHLAVQAASLDSWRGFLAALEAADDFDENAAAAGAQAGFAAAIMAFDMLDKDAELSASV